MKTPKYILVTGGELMNKGAQAMSFITVDQIARRYPEHKVVLFSSIDAKRSEIEKQNYKFEIIPFPGFGESLSLCTGILKRRYLKRENGKYFSMYKNIFKNAVALLDISGYALGSKWGDGMINGYLRKLSLAKHFKIPVYLMPQSFGPFDFKSKRAAKFHSKLKRLLPKAKLIMARENEGFEMLVKTYNLKNVVKTPDMVLQNKEINLENIYYNVPKLKTISIDNGSVAIIPNSKNNKFGNEEHVLSLYEAAINLLLNKNKNVYLLYHAVEDLKICEKIKKTFFPEEEKVHLLTEELSCIEFDEIVDNFDFIIGSRFHSIVHAYRKAVPAIILGWAVKYRELSDSFGQSEYCFDSAKINTCYDEILNKISKLTDCCTEEAKKIEIGIVELQKENIFDLVKI